jgi:hypothetical protein
MRDRAPAQPDPEAALLRALVSKRAAANSVVLLRERVARSVTLPRLTGVFGLGIVAGLSGSDPRSRQLNQLRDEISSLGTRIDRVREVLEEQAAGPGSHTLQGHDLVRSLIGSVLIRWLVAEFTAFRRSWQQGDVQETRIEHEEP